MGRNETIERISKKLLMIGREKDIRQRFFVIGIVLVPILLTVIGICSYNSSLKGEDAKSADANIVVVPDNADEVKDSTGNAVGLAEGSFETAMTTEWHFNSGDSMSGDAYVQNVINNTNDIYFDVALVDDPEHVIYKSPIIPRGSRLENIMLDEKLQPGTYDCILTYYLVDDNNYPVSSLQINIQIIVADQSERT